MFKRQRAVAPFFKVPVPYNPVAGEFAPIGKKVDKTRLALLQVCEEDTHANYVVCRGFDPECGKFFNWAEGDPVRKGLTVAKPFGVRGTYPYAVGQILVCAKPLTALGETSGVASVTVGHPADLDETVEILYDDNGNPIAWMDLGATSPVAGLTPRILYDDVAPGDTDKNVWPVDATMAADTAADKVLVQNTFDGTYRGFGTNHAGFTPSPTAKVWTTTGLDGKEHIVCGQGMAKRCKCQLTGALTATTASCSVDTVTPTDGGQNPVANSTSATLTVYIQLNPSSSGGFAGADNTVCYIEWHEDDDKWWIYEMPCSS